MPGEVKSPAAFPLIGRKTVLQAISLAGGFNEEYANKSTIRIVRTNGKNGQPELISANVASMLAGRTPATLLEPGDVVYVHPTGLATWSRNLTQVLGPIADTLSVIGNTATTALAIAR